MEKSHESREWLQFAKRDYNAAETLSHSRPLPVEIVCFHCQQCAEKAIKAYLIYQSTSFEKTHDLVFLNNKCKALDTDFSIVQTACDRLNPFSVTTRYPSGMELLEEDALLALKDAKTVLDYISDKLTSITTDN